MREVAVNTGLQSAKDALRAYSRIIYKVMSTGTQVSPDMLQPDFFPDWGPDVRDVSLNLDVWRRAIPPETLHTVEMAWDVSEKTKLELYMIWKLTGNLEMIESVDEGLFMILEEVMEELLDEHGYDIDDYDCIVGD
jgi:heterodisulfide reductase subunit C